MQSGRAQAIVMASLYILFLMLPIYWLINMSLKTNAEILGSASRSFPQNHTLPTTSTIFTDPSWYMGYINSLIYVALNTVISPHGALAGGLRLLALPLSSATSTVLLAADQPDGAAAVFALPFFQLYSARSGCSTRTSRWRWRTACSTCRWRCGSSKASCAACPRRSTRPPISTAIRSRVLREDLHAADRVGHRRRGLLLLHVLLGGTAAARTLTTVDAKPIAAIMTRTVGASGIDWGVLAAAGVLTIIPGALVIYFVRNYIAKGFALGRV
jgi:glycerol transport system permease protein